MEQVHKLLYIHKIIIQFQQWSEKYANIIQFLQSFQVCRPFSCIYTDPKQPLEQVEVDIGHLFNQFIHHGYNLIPRKDALLSTLQLLEANLFQDTMFLRLFLLQKALDQDKLQKPGTELEIEVLSTIIDVPANFTFELDTIDGEFKSLMNEMNGCLKFVYNQFEDVLEKNQKILTKSQIHKIKSIIEVPPSQISETESEINSFAKEVLPTEIIKG
ncbi:Hypothetical_protein [Hexamita inflata]|uniref:Hypothetical_protein n=1 Tax=Hexamita inflata TaxID=28002 RepID=A0AA86P2S1_9EUKA|nr:Hypothetical protein HINF_LOCUS18216 [Hexamita inflata]CAI9930579.1 Hypothetical protein HINF_LOCUS18224 [Hexamita inflata]